MNARRAVWLSCLLTVLFALVLTGSRAFFWAGGPVRLLARPAEPGALLQGGDEPGQPSSELLPGERLDLNRASEEALCRLPGIGEALASAIVEARQSRGGFTRTEELLQVPGISPAVYAAIADYLYIGGYAHEDPGR